MDTQNRNITEDYVSLEIAKLLKEKGFNEVCRYEYGVPEVDGGYVLQEFYQPIQNCELIDTAYTAPTLQMACKWLREVHDICVYCYNTNSRCKQYGKYEAGASWISDDVSVIFHNSAHSLYADTYEQAVEEVLKYCLINLID